MKNRLSKLGHYIIDFPHWHLLWIFLTFTWIVFREQIRSWLANDQLFGIFDLLFALSFFLVGSFWGWTMIKNREHFDSLPKWNKELGLIFGGMLFFGSFAIFIWLLIAWIVN